MITNILFFTLICYGISNILVYGSIFQWWRNFLFKLGGGDYSLYKLFTCMMCAPTWVGFALSYLMQLNGLNTPATTYGFENTLLITFLDGVLASGTVYALNTIVEYFEGND